MASRRKEFGELPQGDGNAIELQGGEAVQVPSPTYGNTQHSSPFQEIISPLSPAEPPPYSPQERGNASAVSLKARPKATIGAIRSRTEAGPRLGTASRSEAFRLRERLLNERRASLRKTLRLLDEDQRLRT